MAISKILFLELRSTLFNEPFGYMDGIKVSNKIMTYHVMNKGEQCCCYKAVQKGISGEFDILNNSSVILYC